VVVVVVMITLVEAQGSGVMFNNVILKIYFIILYYKFFNM
jgi:hypothetical protein